MVFLYILIFILHYYVKHYEYWRVLIDYFNLENFHTMPYMYAYLFLSCDFVELTDMFGKKIERLSGYRSGFTVTVRGDRTTLLRIRFTTDVSFTRQGFKAQYNTTFGE